YFYLHQDKFLDQEWFLNAFDSWRKSDITILGFNELKSNRITPYRAKINIEVNSGMDWFNANIQIRFGSQTVPLKQLRRAIRNRSKYIELDDGTHGLLPEEWMEKIAQYLRAGDIDQELLKIPKINFAEVKNLFDQEVLSQEVQ
ncbi:MAG: SNF2 helicase associated domain-containing protein, partial [Sphingobacterium sp.]